MRNDCYIRSFLLKHWFVEWISFFQSQKLVLSHKRKTNLKIQQMLYCDFVWLWRWKCQILWIFSFELLTHSMIYFISNSLIPPIYWMGFTFINFNILSLSCSFSNPPRQIANFYICVDVKPIIRIFMLYIYICVTLGFERLEHFIAQESHACDFFLNL